VAKPVKTVTTTQSLDAEGNVVSETITTTVTEEVKAPEPPLTGMYL
jgi:hypothetical protein